MADLGKMFGASAVDSFLGLPKGTDASLSRGDIAILGAKSATPYLSVGPYCAGGPKALRDASAVYAASVEKWHFDLGGPIFANGVQAYDLGDLPYHETDFAKNRAEIQAQVARILDREAIPVVLGGDDSVPIPVIAAFEGRGPLTILQIDAHIDWRDAVDGETHGLSSTMRRASEMPMVARIVQVGQRGLGSAGVTEIEAAKAFGAQILPMNILRRDGILSALDHIKKGSNVLISLDVDALDPAIMPAVIARTGGGLSYGDIVTQVDALAGHARIAGFNVVEFMPEQDVEDLGAMTAAQLITHVLGRISRQS